MAISTSEQFIDAIRESGLMTTARLDEAIASADGLPDIKATAVRLIKQGFLSRWQANRIISGSYPSYLSKYKLIDLLTESDAGSVYLAEHERMDRRVILKTLTRQKGDDSELVQRFLADARKLATLDHRNIIHIYDVDKEGDVFCLVMEYVHGEDLQRIVERDGPLPFHTAAGYIALSADALGHAHEQGIEHHDVKPDRLLLDKKGELKVLDIGIAGLVDPDQEAWETPRDDGSGEIDYLAPEQATGKNKVDYRADIYALGCTFYFLLTGRPPFEGETADERLKARLRKSPPSVLEHRPDTPPELVDICLRMMATQPRSRVASATEVAKALDQWIKGNDPPVTALPPRPAARRSDSDGNNSDGNGDSDDNGQPAAADSSEFAIAAADPLKERVSKQSSDWRKKKRKNKNTASDSEDLPVGAVPVDPGTVDPEPADTPAVGNKLLSPVVLLSVGGAVLSLLVVVILAIVYWPDGSGDGMRSGSDPTVGDGTPAAAVDEDAAKGLSDIVVTGADGKPGAPLAGGWYPLATDGKPGRYTFSYVAKVSLPKVTGFRIDWLGDEGAPQGILEINEIEAFAGASDQLDATSRLTVAGATGEPTLPTGPATFAIDGNLGTACNIPLAAGKPQQLFCELATPLTSRRAGSDGAPYFVRLVFHAAAAAAAAPPAGRFRVSAETTAIASAIAPAIAAPADAKTLAYWRFEQGSTGAYVKNLNEIGRPAAAEDASKNGNALYCPSPAVAPKLGNDVPAAEVRRGQSVEKNTLSLNDTISPPDGEPARYLITNSVLAKPSVDLASHPLDQWTIEASFKLSKLEGLQTILGKNGQPTATPDAPLQIRVDATKGQIVVAVIDRSGKKCTVASNAAFKLSAGQWVNVAAVCDGKQLILYADALDKKGFLQQAAVPMSGGLIGSFGDWTVGAGSHGDGIAEDASAVIDEVRISTVALDPKDFLFASKTTEVVVVDPKDPKDPDPKDPDPKDPGPVTPPAFHVLQLQKEGAKPDGLTYARQPDGFYLAEGKDYEQATYRLKAELTLKDITGLRLEVAPHEQSGGKVGRSSDGNFVVTNVILQYSDAAGKKKSTVKLTAATADHSEAKKGVAAAIDGNAKTGWAIGPQFDKRHWAVFDAEKPFGDGTPLLLWIDVHQAAGKKNTMAHFRLSAVTGTGRGEQLVAAMRAEQLLAQPFAELVEDALPALPTKDFPAPDFADVRQLGIVQVGTVDDLQASLIGGDVGHGADGSFELQAGDSADGEKMWDFRFTSTATGSKAAVARLRLVGQELSMYWLADAKNVEGADYLRNCSLQLQLHNVTRQLSLRAAADVQPVEFTLGKGNRGGNMIYVPAAPDPKQLRIELKLAPEAFGPYVMEPAGPLLIDQGTVDVAIGESKALKLRLTTAWEAPSIKLRVVGYFRPPGVDKDTVFSLKSAQAALRRVTNTLEPAKLQLAGLEKKKIYDGRKSFKANEKTEYARLQQRFGKLKGKELDAAIERGKAFVTKGAEAADKADELVRLAEKLQAPAEQSGATIQVRVFSLLEDKEVDLVRSIGWQDE